MSDVLRWVVDQYRQKLLEIDREACHQVDLLMTRAGQGWVCDQSIIDPDELVTAQEVEQRFGYRQVNLWALIRRYEIQSRGKKGQSNLYRLGDLLSARAAKKSADLFIN